MAVTPGTKAPATTVAPKIPSTDGYTAQGYCPIPVTVDVTRGATPDKVSWEFNSPVGFTTQDNGTVLNQISGVTLYAGDAAVQSDTATAVNEGDKKVTIGSITYAASEKGVCVWVADLTYWTSEGVTMGGAIQGDGKPLPVIKKDTQITPALLGFKDDAAVAAAVDALSTKAPVYPKADRDLKPGDIVTIKVQRKARITGAVYPTAADEDWTVEDGYQARLNVNVATTGGLGAGGRFGAAGAAVPGDGFDIDGTAKPTAVPATIIPAETSDWAPDAYITVNVYDSSKSNVYVDSEKFTWAAAIPGTGTGGGGGGGGTPAGWKVWTKPTNTIYLGKIASATEAAAKKITLNGYKTTAAASAPTAADLKGLTLDELNDLGGIDFTICLNSGVPQPTGILGAGDLGPGKQWPQGYYTEIASSTVNGTAYTAAYWNGSEFVPCDSKGAPGYLADPYQKPVKL